MPPSIYRPPGDQGQSRCRDRESRWALAARHVAEARPGTADHHRHSGQHARRWAAATGSRPGDGLCRAVSQTRNISGWTSANAKMQGGVSSSFHFSFFEAEPRMPSLSRKSMRIASRTYSASAVAASGTAGGAYWEGRGGWPVRREWLRSCFPIGKRRPIRCCSTNEQPRARGNRLTCSCHCVKGARTCASLCTPPRGAHPRPGRKATGRRPCRPSGRGPFATDRAPSIIAVLSLLPRPVFRRAGIWFAYSRGWID